MQTIVDACGCHASKQSDSRDRGLISSLPIPYCANSLLYVDFMHGLPRFGGYDSDAFPWVAWPLDAAVDTHRQAGRQSSALTGASLRSCHVTKRFRILATLKQGNKSMYSNTSGYVHMG